MIIIAEQNIPAKFSERKEFLESVQDKGVFALLGWYDLDAINIIRTADERLEKILAVLALDAEFSIESIRTLDINETIGETKCTAKLRFGNLEGKVTYTIQNTSDGELYVGAHLPNLLPDLR
ncbi:hypothetical protein [Candidatus Spongiihabitans sp.]|uniref:hypothetical protein n=1 Tax=Candidatus Spongiihabitans sp. TaxID=3101308 RepID=UPI003C6FE07E